MSPKKKGKKAADGPPKKASSSAAGFTWGSAHPVAEMPATSPRLARKKRREKAASRGSPEARKLLKEKEDGATTTTASRTRLSQLSHGRVVKRYRDKYNNHPHVKKAAAASADVPGITTFGPDSPPTDSPEGAAAAEAARRQVASESGLVGPGSGPPQELFSREQTCYYGGGLSCVVQTFLCVPMIYFGTEHLFQCPAAPFVPMILLCGGVIHLFWSLPFSGLFLYAMARVTAGHVLRRKISNVLSPVARSAANAFFSSWIGYALDMMGVVVFSGVVAFTVIKFAGQAGLDWEAFSQRDLGEGGCHRDLVRFSFFCFSFHLLFLAALLVVVCVGCWRNDYCRTHYLFREDKEEEAVAKDQDEWTTHKTAITNMRAF